MSPTAMTLRAVAVYCGSKAGTDTRHAETAQQLGALLATNGIEVIYGGGHVGLMGIVADAAITSGGRVTGVITNDLMKLELGHGEVSELIRVETMHERKLAMNQRADGFVMLPGGYGTLDEFFEAVTWSQLGIHAKPCTILDPTGYYEPLLAFLDRSVAEGFVTEPNRELIRYVTDLNQLLGALQT